MLFAIDYDGTYTGDPILFNVMMDLMLQRGHEYVLVTQRGIEHNEGIRKVIPENMTIINCPGVPKWMAVLQAGLKVDVWIEDNPHALFNGYTYTGAIEDDPAE